MPFGKVHLKREKVEKSGQKVEELQLSTGSIQEKYLREKTL